MPYYDLKCSKCGNIFSTKATIKERENKEIACEKCSGNELEAVFTSVNIVRSKKTQVSDCPISHSCKGCCHH